MISLPVHLPVCRLPPCPLSPSTHLVLVRVASPIQLGFDTLLRGLRDDVKPSLRRRVLQAVATLVTEDPSLAPFLLGIDPDDPPTEQPQPPDIINNSNYDVTEVKASKSTPIEGKTTGAPNLDRKSGRLSSGVRRRLRGAARRGASAVGTATTIVDERSTSGGGDTCGSPQDGLLDRVTVILGFHSGSTTTFGNGVASEGGPDVAGAAFGIESYGAVGNAAAGAGSDGMAHGKQQAAVVGGVSGPGPLGRAVRAVVELIPLPGIRPSSLPSAVMSSPVDPRAVFLRAAAAATAATGRVIAAVGVGNIPAGGSSGVGGLEGSAGDGGSSATSEEGRDWWKDEVCVCGCAG